MVAVKSDGCFDQLQVSPVWIKSLITFILTAVGKPYLIYVILQLCVNSWLWYWWELAVGLPLYGSELVRRHAKAFEDLCVIGAAWSTCQPSIAKVLCAASPTDNRLSPHKKNFRYPLPSSQSRDLLCLLSVIFTVHINSSWKEINRVLLPEHITFRDIDIGFYFNFSA